MHIDVRDILKTSGLSKAVALELTAGACGIADAGGECDFDEPVCVSVELANIKGMIRAKGAVSTGYASFCARCLKPVRVAVSCGFDDEYVPYGSLGDISAEDAEVFEYTEKEVDIGLSVRDAVLLNIPIRHLCGEGCMSLCPMCGRDLNLGACGCKQPAGDPRFAVLDGYFKQDI